MALKLPPRPRFYCVKLLVAVSVLACVYGGSAATDQTMGVETPLHALDLDQSRTRVHRHLRAADASFEERLFENIPGVAKVLEKLKPDKQKAASKYFAKLQLDKTTSNLLENPAFQKFERFVAKSYRKTPGTADTAILSTLTTYHGDEVVAQMLAAAKEVPRTKTLATKLEGILFSNWIQQKKTADDAFKLMKLNHEADDILTNPALKSWIRYVDGLSEDPYKLLLIKMKTRYTDLELAGMLAGAKQRFATSSIAEGMENALLNRWLSEKISADTVFKLLKLDEEGDKLLQNPLLNTWASYVKTLDSLHSDQPVFLALRTRYGEEGLAKMLLAKSERTVSLAGRLENVQLNTWKTEGRTADDIFKLLNVPKHSEKLLENAEFKSWVIYVTRMEKGDSDEVVMSVLRTHFDGKTLASMLDAAKGNPGTKTLATRLEQELWLSEGKSVEDVFKLLKLDEAGDDILKSSELGSWVSYVTKVNTRGRPSDEFAAISVLKGKIGDWELAMRLSAAKITAKMSRNGGDEQAIGSLQTLQFKQWKREGMPPDRVTLMIKGADEFDTWMS